MAKQSKEDKALDKRVDQLFNQYCNRIQIPIMKLSLISGFARATFRTDPTATDESVGAAMREMALKLSQE